MIRKHNLTLPQAQNFAVVTTIGMITDIVKNVGADRVEVIGLMGPGVDPHLYNASAGDVQKLNSASLIFYNGLHLESKMGDILAKMSGNIKTVAVTDAIDRNLLLKPPEFEGQYDPHLWFDVTLWMQAVGTVRDVLSEFDPDNHSNVLEQRRTLSRETLGTACVCKIASGTCAASAAGARDST